MSNPYYRTMLALSHIRGPLVNDWVEDQVTALTEKVTHQQNQIPRTENVLWTEYEAAFDSAFTDTTKKQRAQSAIQQLRMRGDDLDSYVSTFKHIAKQAEYSLDAQGTIYLFALGLKPGLLRANLHRENPPNTMEEWIAAARTELQKLYRCQVFMYPGQIQHGWTNQQPKQ